MSGVWGPVPELQSVYAVTLLANMSQVAGTYTAGTVSGGDVLVLSVQPFVGVAAAGLTSLTVQTNNTTPDVILASTLLVALTVGKNLTALVTPFVLPSTKLIQYTIVGTGSGGGALGLAIRYQPMTAGARLA